MNYKVSIIVPVYNTEEYLPRCIKSILNQTYKNIEVILVNDGSTDQSGQICDLFANKDDRVLVIHKKNTGVSDSRNEGIKLSSGKYLQFVDSDDYIDENMTEILIEAVQHGEADIAICGYKVIDYKTEKSVPRSYSQPEMNFDFKRLLTIFDDLYLKADMNSPCNKMYISSLIKKNRIYFDPKLDLGEDLIFNLEVIKKCDKFSIISACPYNYIQYDNGQNLTGKLRTNMYEIQKRLFEQAVAIYTDRGNYSEQISNLEQEYTRTILLGLVLYFAVHTSLKNYQIYKEKALAIQRDEVFERRINSLKVSSLQDKLVIYFLKHNMYAKIFIYAKSKVFIRNKLPIIYKYLKKFGSQ